MTNNPQIHDEIIFQISVLKGLGLLKVSNRRKHLWAAGSVIQVLAQDPDLLFRFIADCKKSVKRYGKAWLDKWIQLAVFILDGYGLDFIDVRQPINPELNKLEGITSYMRQR